ncbi:unnamed protein product [Anisakis simplex]|uniref:FHA domain-containing protein n=1 Tax=Anisakis simplex TaxID=6269 RepID=A0A0M3K0K2_ANISI|nr:unnamed protein product [Anisakis simplex]
MLQSVSKHLMTEHGVADTLSSEQRKISSLSSSAASGGGGGAAAAQSATAAAASTAAAAAASTEQQQQQQSSAFLREALLLTPTWTTAAAAFGIPKSLTGSIRFDSIRSDSDRISSSHCVVLDYSFGSLLLDQCFVLIIALHCIGLDWINSGNSQLHCCACAVAEKKRSSEMKLVNK